MVSESSVNVISPFSCITYMFAVVHAIMYGYFGCTQVSQSWRRAVRPYAACITLLQLSQMVVGIVVTVASVTYSGSDTTCQGKTTNAALGLAMYASYFVLFLEFFIRHFVLGKRSSKKGKEAGKDQ